jgi:H+-transporting ATPase
LAIVGTQVFAVLMCGFGWFVTALPWIVILMVWVYMLIWMIVLDLVKLAIYRRIAGRSPRLTSAQRHVPAAHANA